MDSSQGRGQGSSAQQRVVLPSNSELLRFKVHQGVTRLFKNFLFMVENLRDEHDEKMGRLEEALPDESKHLVSLADSFGDAKMESLRLRILAEGNNAIRDLQDTIDGLHLDRKGD